MARSGRRRSGFEVKLHIFRKIQIVCIILCFVFFTLLEILTIYLSSSEKYAPIIYECGLENNSSSVNLDVFVSVYNVSREEALEKFKAKKGTWEDGNETRVCPCLVKTCVHKCCPDQQSLRSYENLTCVDDFSSTVLNLVRSVSVYYRVESNERLANLRPKITVPRDFYVVPDHLVCGLGNISDYRNVERYLMEDGTLLTRNYTYIDINDYCFEFIEKEVVAITENDCNNKYGPTKNKVMNFKGDYTSIYFMVILFIQVISLLSAILTFITYVLLPQLRNSSGKIIMCYLACAIVNMSSKMAYFIASVNKDLTYSSYFYVSVFTLLGMFTWLTILCFDFWCNFSSPLTHSFNPKVQKLKFISYSIFGWGFPFTSCILTVLIDIIPKHFDVFCTKPRFAKDECFFGQHHGLHLFYSMPLILMFLLNITMTVSTLCNMFCLHTPKRRVSSGRMRRHGRVGEGLCLYVKLAFVMGFQFCLSFILIMIEQDGSRILFVISDSSYGIGLFLALVCNKRTFGLLKGKWSHRDDVTRTRDMSLT